MQRLMRFRALWGTHTSCHGFRPAPQKLRYQALSGAGAPGWSDHNRPEEFNFARDVVDHWAQLEKVRGHLGGLAGLIAPWEAEGHRTTTAPGSAPRIPGKSQCFGGQCCAWPPHFPEPL